MLPEQPTITRGVSFTKFNPTKRQFPLFPSTSRSTSMPTSPEPSRIIEQTKDRPRAIAAARVRQISIQDVVLTGRNRWDSNSRSPPGSQRGNRTSPFSRNGRVLQKGGGKKDSVVEESNKMVQKDVLKVEFLARMVSDLKSRANGIMEKLYMIKDLNKETTKKLKILEMTYDEHRNNLDSV